MMRRRFLQYTALIGAASTVAGCDAQFGGWGNKEIEWRETVVLASGVTVPIVRHLEYTVTGGIPSPRSATVWRRAILRSDSDPPAFPVWDAPVTALLLEQDAAGHFWIVAATDSPPFWNSNGEPPFGYWAFVVKGGRWVLTDMPDAYFGRYANLLVDIRDDDPRTISQTEVEARKSRPGGQKTLESHRQIRKEMPPGYKRGLPQPPIVSELKPFLE